MASQPSTIFPNCTTPTRNPALRAGATRPRRDASSTQLVRWKKKKMKTSSSKLLRRTTLSACSIAAPNSNRLKEAGELIWPELTWPDLTSSTSLAHARPLPSHNPGSPSLRRLLRRNPGKSLDSVLQILANGRYRDVSLITFAPVAQRRAKSRPNDCSPRNSRCN